MRSFMLGLFVAACADNDQHFVLDVTIEHASDDPAAALVEIEASAWEDTGGHGDTTRGLEGIEASVVLDGSATELREIGIGYYENIQRTGFPGTIEMIVEGTRTELTHTGPFTATVARTSTGHRVDFTPPVQPGEIVRAIGSMVGSSATAAEGSSSLDLGAGNTQLRFERIGSNTYAVDSLAVQGNVRAFRNFTAP